MAQGLGISITGKGIVCAIGRNAGEVAHTLLHGGTGVGRMQYLSSAHTELPVGEVKMSDLELKAALGVPSCDTVSRTTLLGALAVRQALADAGLTADALKGRRVALLSGTTVGGMDVTERLYTEMLTDDGALSRARHHDCGSCTADIARLTGLRDCEVCTVSTACSSALNAIMVGAEMLADGEADVVVAGGAEAMSRFHLNGFNTLMILDSGACRPFDATRGGLNLGEGAAYVVMERGADAVRTQAYIAGYANRCDAYHQTASSADGEGAFLAMSEALRMAGMSPMEIDYINAHGTGTPNNDASESAAIRRVFSNEVPPVSSTKGFTGHTTSASGAVEAVICIMAMRQGFIPRNEGWHTQDEGCVTPVAETRAADMDSVMCNSFGFGGNDSSMVLCGADRGGPLRDRKRRGAEKVCVETAADITIDSEEAMADIREHIKPMEARRMGRMMKAATLSAMKALRAAGTERPDAIVTATAYGMLETSERFLDDMCRNGESLLKPTLFMQSTHNTIGSGIAIRTGCHGYNITYSQGADSMAWAMRDARRLIETGQARTVLVEHHDESTPTVRDFFRRMGAQPPLEVYSRSVVLRAKD
ncbi:MAG: beta-ketoacyl-[acyl-carrier-protein] synthase family protein [Prevotellaceae bacterium]|nr:beta-ketoacyl-[acyl-carrier-protein] synthase family protein [Prevotellaceae bacterium]